MVMKSSVSLRADQHAFARSLVDSGRFPSISAVVQKGQDLLKQQDADAQAERAALQALLQQRADGPFISAAVLRSAHDRGEPGAMPLQASRRSSLRRNVWPQLPFGANPTTHMLVRLLQGSTQR